MIKIEERLAHKLSGFTNLFVDFGYNEEYYNFILQNIPVFRRDKKTKEWEIPIIYLRDLLDYFNEKEDISLILYNEVENKLINQPKLEYKVKPYEHQKEAIIMGLNLDRWLLLDDMGLGKTASIIHIAEELKYQRGINHCLVVCGINTLKANWKKEIKFHSNETFRVVGEKVSKNGNISYATIKERVAEIKKGIEEFFVIVNIETLRDDDFIDAINEQKYDMIIVDEIHKSSNKQSKQGENLLKLKSKYKIAATGTLLVNTPLNCYLPLRWIDVEKGSLTNFKNEYVKYGGFGNHEIVGYQNLDILKDEIDRCSLRRKKEDVLKDLPLKTIIKEYITLSDAHRKFYESVKEGIKEECDKIELNTGNLLALVTRLRQASSCPSILTTQDIESSKLSRCKELVDDLIANGEKVVVFSTFKESVYKLGEMLEEYKPLICTGDNKEVEISNNIDLFQTDESRKLLIGTHQKMGTGITLTASSYMIFIDTPFTASSFNQACDRIYRIGTTRPVFIYNLICENTIDERVAYIIDSKQAISDFVIDDTMTEDELNILRDYIKDII